MVQRPPTACTVQHPTAMVRNMNYHVASVWALIIEKHEEASSYQFTACVHSSCGFEPDQTGANTPNSEILHPENRRVQIYAQHPQTHPLRETLYKLRYTPPTLHSLQSAQRLLLYTRIPRHNPIRRHFTFRTLRPAIESLTLCVMHCKIYSLHDDHYTRIHRMYAAH